MHRVTHTSSHCACARLNQVPMMFIHTSNPFRFHALIFVVPDLAVGDPITGKWQGMEYAAVITNVYSYPAAPGGKMRLPCYDVVYASDGSPGIYLTVATDELRLRVVEPPRKRHKKDSDEVLSDLDSEDERNELLQASSYPASSHSAAAVAAGQHQQRQHHHHHHQASLSTATPRSTKAARSATSGSASRPQPLSQHDQRQPGPAWSNGFTAGTAASGVAPAKQQQQYQQETQQQQTYSRSSLSTRDQALSSAPISPDYLSPSPALQQSSGALVGRGSRVAPQPSAASYTSASSWNPETRFNKPANTYAAYQPTSMLPSTASAALSVGRQPPPQYGGGGGGGWNTLPQQQLQPGVELDDLFGTELDDFFAEFGA